MSIGSGFERQYTEKEASKVLRRAAELQSHNAESPHASDGVTSEELMRIGQEVGLDPACIRAALDGLEDDGNEVQTRWLGAPPSYELERVVEGSLTDARWNVLVGELNSTFHQSIEGVSAGSSRTWHWKHDFGAIHFTAVQQANSVRLKLVAFIDDGIAVGMVPTIGAMVVGGMVSWTNDALRPWFSLLITVAVMVGLGASFRSIVSRWYRRDRKKLGRIMTSLQVAIHQMDESLLMGSSLSSEAAISEQQLGQS